MQISLILAQQIAELFLILLIGCVLVKARLLKSADSRVLSVVMVYAVMPCVIINAFQVDYSPAVVTGLLYAFALAIALHALLLLLARLLRRPLRLDVIERTCIIYTNAGILVIPLVRALLGEDYVIYSCAFLVVQQVLLWTHCRSLLCGTRGFEWKKIIGNVNIIAILIGGALFILRLPLPGLVNDLFSQLGAMVGPIGMLLAGIIIADTPLRQLFMRRRHYVPVLLRLINLSDYHSAAASCHRCGKLDSGWTQHSADRVSQRASRLRALRLLRWRSFTTAMLSIPSALYVLTNAVFHPHHATDGMGCSRYSF